jgi:DNA-binding transcriptional regulator YhcF (GntR family)
MPKPTNYADLGDFDVLTSRPPNPMMEQPPPPPPSQPQSPARRRLPPSSHKREATYRALRDLIAAGALRQEHDFLLQPLAQRLDVSRNTLTRALDRLVADELVRYARHKGYALLIPTGQQLELRFSAAYAEVRSALILGQGEKRQRHYGLDRGEKLALAELLPDLAPPRAVAAELDELLRIAFGRAGADPARRSAFALTLARLALVRQVEHLVVPDHREDVAQLMRSFYRGQYDRFLRTLGLYTTKRIRVAAELAAAVQHWATRAEVE